MLGLLSALLLAINLSGAPPAGPVRLPAKLSVAAGGRIAFEGDSLIYGQDETESGTRGPINGAGQKRSRNPLPEYLEGLLDHGVEVDNRGFPGDRTVDGIDRWRQVDKAALVFIMYGSNDAMNFGGYPDGGTSLARYSENLRTLIGRRRSAGATVVLMTPPPVLRPDWDARIAPYRLLAKGVAAELGVPAIDTGEVLSGVSDKWVDGLHLSAHSLEVLGGYIRQHIAVVGREGRPHAQ